jgi:hypothetical protein
MVEGLQLRLQDVYCARSFTWQARRQSMSMGGQMPQIIVTADRLSEDAEPPILFRERVSVGDFESDHFAAQLVERLGWAVGDADEVNRRSQVKAEQLRARQRVIDAAQREMNRGHRTRRSASVVTTAS